MKVFNLVAEPMKQIVLPGRTPNRWFRILTRWSPPLHGRSRKVDDGTSRPRNSLVFKLEHKLHLAWVLGFDQRAESARVVGADPQPVRVVQEIERFRSKLNFSALVHNLDGLHEAQIHGNGSWQEAVSPEADGTRAEIG